jgi:hypothetical protein
MSNNKCYCECHVNENIVHFCACCDGECFGCGVPFYNLKEHEKECQDYNNKVKQMKRKARKRFENNNSR